jgi:hypothetical protein
MVLSHITLSVARANDGVGSFSAGTMAIRSDKRHKQRPSAFMIRQGNRRNSADRMADMANMR